MKLKFCGLTRIEDIEAANETRPDYIGFVFADSRRHVSDLDAARLKEHLDPEIKAVGVFVNDEPEHIAALVKDAISESEMEIYSDSTAQYGLTDRGDNNVRVYASRKAGNENALDDLTYPKNAFPTETVEKYRAAAEKLAQDPTSNAVTLDGDTMVTRTSLG